MSGKMSGFEYFARTKGRFIWAGALAVAIVATFLPFLALPGTLTLTALLGQSLGPGMSFYSLADTLGKIVEGAAVLGVDPSMKTVAMIAGWAVCAIWIAVIAAMGYLAVRLVQGRQFRFVPVVIALAIAIVASLLFLIIPSVANPAFSSILGKTFGSETVAVDIFDWTPWQLIAFCVSLCSLPVAVYARKLQRQTTPESRAAFEQEVATRKTEKAASRARAKAEKKDKKEAKVAARKPNWKRKRYAIWGGVAAVVIVAAVGFNAWHQTPQFCNSVCHSPMDRYVAGYLSESDDLLVTAHAKAQVNCIQCHDDGIDTQVREAVQWVTGDFSDPIGVTRIGTRAFCLRCHDDGNSQNGIDWNDIVASTADYGGDVGVNPHSSHNGLQECGTCHSSHGVSVISCNTCHDLEVPEGWAGSIEEASRMQAEKGLPA